MASGIAWLSSNTDTSLSEYTTKVQVLQPGALFRGTLYISGFPYLLGKAIKGKNLVDHSRYRHDRNYNYMHLSLNRISVQVANIINMDGIIKVGTFEYNQASPIIEAV